MSTAQHPAPEPMPTLFGHPSGLFVLFFAEMWERFSYYGMRALLVLYMIKGFMAYGDEDAYLVYGAYTSMVWATPFIGGLLADRFLGERKAVLLGGTLMAAGHLLMTIEQQTVFFMALALIITGNGFFKPNISTVVGALYPEGASKRDGGFTIFYMGINLGAAIAPLLCGYVGETYGWHYGFGLATGGMLVGLAVFAAPTRLTQALILLGALGTGAGMVLVTDGLTMRLVNGFVALALIVAGFVAFAALNRAGLPAWAGAPPDPDRLRKPLFAGLKVEWAIYLGALLAVPLFALLVQHNTVAGALLGVLGGLAFLSLVVTAFRAAKVERERLFVVLILMFFSMLFWAFFEQAGSSINLFTDRNVDRVIESNQVTPDQVRQTISVRLTQEQVGHTLQGRVLTIKDIDTARESGSDTVSWRVAEDDVGMGLGGEEVPASTFQAANPIFILSFGLLFTALWGFLGKRGLEPSTPVKFSLGLLQLGLGFVAIWYGATAADDRGMVWMGWLLLGYLLHTTGELCLSPVGLSMVTRLAPKRIVSTVMGAWFLATAFSSYLAALIAMLTGLGGEGEGGEEALVPLPHESVGVYGEVFGQIAIAAVVSAVVVFAISPVLRKWMHEDEFGPT